MLLKSLRGNILKAAEFSDEEKRNVFAAVGYFIALHKDPEVYPFKTLDHKVFMNNYDAIVSRAIAKYGPSHSIIANFTAAKYTIMKYLEIRYP